jgi:hypothetical protein
MNVDLQQYRDLKIFMKYVLPSQHVIMEFAFIMRVSNLVSIMAFLEMWVLLSSKRAIFQVYYYENELLFDELGHHEEWVSDCCFNANSAIFQLYHDENKLIFKEIMMRSTLF